MTTTNNSEPPSTISPTTTSVATPMTPTAPATLASTPTQGTESVMAKANRVLEQAEFSPGKPRQIVDAALLSMCVAFFIALLSMTKLDSYLNNAVVCFGGAMPLIGWGYMQAALTPKPTSGWLVLRALLIGAWVAEGIGELAVYIGVLLILWHFSYTAFLVTLLTSALAIVGVPILSFIGLLIYAFISVKKEEAGKQTPPATPVASTASAAQAATPGQTSTP